MPIYEYHCQACDHDFEVLQKVNETEVPVCPHCQGKSVERLVSAAGFHLKGTGWYATDFKTKPPGPAANSETKKEPAAVTSPAESTNSSKSTSVKGQDK